MEMREPSALEEQQPLADQTLNADAGTPGKATSDSAPAECDNIEIQTVTATGNNPEAAAEQEMTEAVEHQVEQEELVKDQLTRDIVMERARELESRDAADISRDEINRLRQQFNALRHTESDSEAPVIDAEAEKDDAEFHAILTSIKEKKARWVAQLEAQRAANLDRKNAIIAEMQALAQDTDNINRTFPRYRELQDEFNTAGDVPPTEETALWKRFQEAREHYSDNLKINKELRDYDFKKNLDAKQLLLDEARTLAADPDVITAYRHLQELHAKWRAIGPVAKELRDGIWNEFKDFSAEINKRYQAFFEERKAREAENEAGKTEICERVEVLDFSSLKSFAAWDQMTKTIITAQEDWKKLGFASKKMNNALFARFRATCDKFFAAKAEYFRNTKEELARNLERKTALADEAEALKDSTDWKQASDRFVEMQKEWKSIGTVAKKHSDAVWNRFLAACDYFFEQKKKATSGQRHAEQANLKAKREIIAALEAIDLNTVGREEAITTMRELQDRWQNIGHVPFRDKDKVYDAYRARINELRGALDLRESRARIDRFAGSVAEIEGDDSKLYRERERLLRQAEAKRAELRTYENNLGFLSSKSKTGESMVKEFTRKIDRIKDEIASIAEKIKIVDSKL